MWLLRNDGNSEAFELALEGLGRPHADDDGLLRLARLMRSLPLPEAERERGRTLLHRAVIAQRAEWAHSSSIRKKVQSTAVGAAAAAGAGILVASAATGSTPAQVVHDAMGKMPLISAGSASTINAGVEGQADLDSGSTAGFRSGDGVRGDTSHSGDAGGRATIETGTNAGVHGGVGATAHVDADGSFASGSVAAETEPEGSASVDADGSFSSGSASVGTEGSASVNIDSALSGGSASVGAEAEGSASVAADGSLSGGGASVVTEAEESASVDADGSVPSGSASVGTEAEGSASVDVDGSLSDRTAAKDSADDDHPTVGGDAGGDSSSGGTISLP